MQGEVTEADMPTIRLGAGLISDPPPSSPLFTRDALLAATFPIYFGLGQAPNPRFAYPVA